MSRQGAPWQRIDRTLLSIQYLRAGAALVVVFVHAIVPKFGLLETMLSEAMDLFFVMSGFIVVMICDEDTRPLQFMRERIERIVPLYWIATLASYCLIYSGVLTNAISLQTQLAGLVHGPLSELAAALFFIPAVNSATGTVQPIIPQGWTLNYEMMFYLCFALALVLPRKRIAPALTLSFLALLVAGALFARSVQTQYWTSPVIFEFIAGLWIGLAWRNGWDFRYLFMALLLAWVPLAIAAVAFFGGWPMFPDRIVRFPIVLLVCLPIIAADRQRNGLPHWRGLRLIGDASYSIYLFHFIPIVLAQVLIGTARAQWPVYFIAVFFGGIGLGLAAYFLIERPLMRWVKAARRARLLAATG